ncbi:MAG: UDP-2,3-diacylglucosamine diphosphatase [Fibrobacteres bacterium]|nr:UDP-2,3-diacylglucosamine diphosphatase [Fibrobacterota bacterium]
MEAWAPSWIPPLVGNPVPLGRTVFLSDLHLGMGREEPSRRADLAALLEELPGNADDLVVGGDMFEFWWEWRNALPRGFDDVLDGFRQLTRAGVRLRLIAGNHDFALGQGLASRCGAIIHPDGLLGRSEGADWLLVHGDASTPAERADRILRRILRSKFCQGAWNLLPCDVSFPLALGVGRGSRALDDGTSPHTPAMEPTMRGWMRRWSLAGVVHGHSHRPLWTQGPEGTYINNGDWVRGRWAVWLRGRQSRLVDCTGKDRPWLSNI